MLSEQQLAAIERLRRLESSGSFEGVYGRAYLNADDEPLREHQNDVALAVKSAIHLAEQPAAPEIERLRRALADCWTPLPSNPAFYAARLATINEIVRRAANPDAL